MTGVQDWRDATPWPCSFFLVVQRKIVRGRNLILCRDPVNVELGLLILDGWCYEIEWFKGMGRTCGREGPFDLTVRIDCLISDVLNNFDGCAQA